MYTVYAHLENGLLSGFANVLLDFLFCLANDFLDATWMDSTIRNQPF